MTLAVCSICGHVGECVDRIGRGRVCEDCDAELEAARLTALTRVCAGCGELTRRAWCEHCGKCPKCAGRVVRLRGWPHCLAGNGCTRPKGPTAGDTFPDNLDVPDLYAEAEHVHRTYEKNTQ